MRRVGFPKSRSILNFHHTFVKQFEGLKVEAGGVCPWVQNQRDIKALTALFMMLFISAVGLRGSVSPGLVVTSLREACHVLLITANTS